MNEKAPSWTGAFSVSGSHIEIGVVCGEDQRVDQAVGDDERPEIALVDQVEHAQRDADHAGRDPAAQALIVEMPVAEDETGEQDGENQRSALAAESR